MATNDIGRVTPIWRGFYSAAATYELNDIVIDTAGSVWWHKSPAQTTGVIPEAGEIWDAVIDMSVFSALIQAAITTAQTAVQAAQEAESGVAEDVRRAETAAQSAEASAEAASESAAGVGALAQAAEQSKTEAQTAATQAAASASSAGTSAASAGSSAQTAEAAKTAAQTAATQAAGSAETASGAAAVVEQKKAEALAAIEAKGEEVLESIPEDYTELSGDVGDLKTQLNDLIQQTTFSYGAISDDGTDNPNPVYTRVRSPLFAIAQDAYISAKDGEKYILYQYDSNGTFEEKVTPSWVIGATMTKMSKEKKYRVMAALSNDAAMQVSDISNMKNDVVVVYCDIPEALDSILKAELSADINATNKKIDSMGTASTNLFLEEFEVGMIQNNGVIDSTVTDVLHSPKIEVEPSTQYTLKVFGDNPNVYRANLIYKYTANNAFLGMVSTSDSEMTCKSFTTDYNCAYIRFRTSSPATIEGAKAQEYMFVKGTEPSTYQSGGYAFNFEDHSIAPEKVKFIPNLYNYIYNHPVANDGSDPNGFDAEELTTAEVYSAYDALIALLPNNTKKTVLGTDQSGTFNINQYEFYQPYSNITNGSGTIIDSSPHMALNVIITSGTHGNGTGGDNTDSIISLYEFLKDVYTSAEDNNIFEWIRNNVHFVIIPVVNPWGVDNKSRYNSRDVDINRNFPFGWTETTHSGTQAESEKETQIVMDVFDANPNAHLHIEIHTRGGNTLAESVPPFLSQVYTDCPTQFGMQYIQGYLAKYFGNHTSGIHRDPQGGEMPSTSWKTYGIPSVLIECAHNIDDNGKHTKRCDQINTSMVGNTIYRLSQFVVDNARQIIKAQNE